MQIRILKEMRYDVQDMQVVESYRIFTNACMAES